MQYIWVWIFSKVTIYIDSSILCEMAKFNHLQTKIYYLADILQVRQHFLSC